MKKHIAAITVAADDARASHEVAALVNRLLALGVAKAEELLTQAENAANPESLTYDPEAQVDEDLRALSFLGCELKGVNDFKPGYSPNTLYVLGTDTKGELVVRGSRSSFDAVKDTAIMHAALELSQAVELRNVSFPEHKVGALLVRPAGHTSTQLLLQKAMASLAQVGDIYTDAAETRGAVKTAQNLGILANLLSADNAIICHGMLRGDGDDVAEVDIRADGSFLVVVADLKESARWSVATLGKEYPVTFFAGECGDDETWVVGDAHAFYGDYLGSLTV